MKKNYLIALGLLVACVWSMKNVDMSASELAYAADEANGNTNFIVTVTNPEDKVYVNASATYALSYTLDRNAIPLANSPTGTLDSGTLVDDDGATLTITDTEGDGFTLLEHRLPHMKISGLLAESATQSDLDVKQSTSENDSNVIRVGFGNTTGAWASGNRADDAASNVKLYGTGPKCAVVAVDGEASERVTGDADGDVGFPHAAGCLTTVYIDDRGGAVGGVTDGLMFTFTKG